MVQKSGVKTTWDVQNRNNYKPYEYWDIYYIWMVQDFSDQ